MTNIAKPTEPWPFFGYAPGNYMNNCADCGAGVTHNDMDKRALRCLEHAVIQAKDHIEALEEHAASAPQEPDDELIERLKDMRDFCRGTTHTHPHPNNVARLCEDVLAVLQAKAPETGEG
jgi:hypothetical protein